MRNILILICLSQPAYAGSYGDPIPDNPIAGDTPEFVWCPPKYGKRMKVQKGHEHALCRSDDKPTPEPKPVECSFLSLEPNARYALNGKKKEKECA